jgi:cytochrome c-type biogenesis protein CcsB
MAELAIYLYWTSLMTAALATLTYWAYVASASLAGRRVAAQTSAGTVNVSLPGVTPNVGLGRLATALTLVTTLLLTGWVVTRWVAGGHPPITNMYGFTTALAYGIAASYLVFETIHRNRRYGAFVLPTVVAMLAIASTFPMEIIPLIPALQNAPLLTIHVSMMMVSYAVLTVAFCGAVVYLIQGGSGKRRFGSLPSSESAGDLAHRAVLVGFPLLGLGIALGAYWANSAWGRYWGWDPKETSSLVTWLSLVAYFHARAGSGSVAGAPGIRRLVPARLRRGWRPDPMWWLVVMWGLIMFTYFGVNLWIGGLHAPVGL